MGNEEGLAARIRGELADKGGGTEKKMFGGFAFLWHGHMFVGTAKGKLMVRVGPDRYDALYLRRSGRLRRRPGSGALRPPGPGARRDRAEEEATPELEADRRP